MRLVSNKAEPLLHFSFICLKMPFVFFRGSAFTLHFLRWAWGLRLLGDGGYLSGDVIPLGPDSHSSPSQTDTETCAHTRAHKQCPAHTLRERCYPEVLLSLCSSYLREGVVTHSLLCWEGLQRSDLMGLREHLGNLSGVKEKQMVTMRRPCEQEQVLHLLCPLSKYAEPCWFTKGKEILSRSLQYSSLFEILKIQLLLNNHISQSEDSCVCWLSLSIKRFFFESSVNVESITMPMCEAVIWPMCHLQ